MTKPFDPAVLPEAVRRFAETEVAAGRYATIEDVLCACIKALQERMAIERDFRAAIAGGSVDRRCTGGGGSSAHRGVGREERRPSVFCP